MQRGDGELDILVKKLPAPFDDDHRAVLEIANALPRFVAGLDQPDDHLFAGQHDGLQRRCQIVDIDDIDTAKLRRPCSD